MYTKRYGHSQKKLLKIVMALVSMLVMDVLVSCGPPLPAKKEIPASVLPPFMVPGHVPTAVARQLAGSMDEDQRIGQTLLVHLRWVAKGEAGWLLDEDQKAMLRILQPGGVVLYAQHIGTIAQTQALIAEIRSLCRIPPFIAIDEEGGRVSRLATAGALPATRIPPARILAESGAEAVSAAYAIIGKELWALGFNMDFAPVADLGYPESDAVIGDRSFGTDPAKVGEMVSLAIQGLQSNGICAVIKHFPGHGRSSGDSHFGKQVVKIDWGTLWNSDLVPFRSAVAAGAGAMMTAHIEYPLIDPAARPVSLSRVMLQEKLRGELGYTGLVITDALDMQGVLAVDAPEEIAVQSLEAGVDMLLSPENPTKVVAAIKRALAENRLDSGILTRASERIIEVKNRFGILGVNAAGRSPVIAKAILDSPANRAMIESLVGKTGTK